MATVKKDVLTLDKDALLGARTDEGRKTVHADVDPAKLEDLRAGWDSSVFVEPLRPRHPMAITPYHVETSLDSENHPAGVGTSISVTAIGEDEPLADALGQLTVVHAGGTGQALNLSGKSDDSGVLRFVYDPTEWVPAQIALIPRHSFWGWVQVNPADGQTIDVPPLPKTGPVGWWHQLTGMTSYSEGRGAGIRVGIIDSGCGPHPYLDAVQRVGSIVSGTYDETDESFVGEHGTHVTGIIAARPVSESGEYGGIAPGSDVFVVRVFPESGGASQGDIAEAIELLAEVHQVDLINMSLGSPSSSRIENDAINYAAELGTLCVAAAGNSFGQPILYPAAYGSVAAVAALGVVGGAPPDSVAERSYPPTAADAQVGNMYVANFSNAGVTMTGSAPGVGIISTAPRKKNDVIPAPYLDLSGTSMASPVACGALASLLGEDSEYKKLPRGLERTQYASFVLNASWRPSGLAQRLAGAGISQSWPV